MNKVIADKWIKALRSGKYKQGTGRLRDDNQFCCLGVLCDISKKGKWNKTHYKIGNNVSVAMLPKEVANWAEMKSTDGSFELKGEYDKSKKLWSLNDNLGESFTQIAFIIEKEWENL